MHFQTNRIKMKTLMSLSVMALVLAGCTSAKHQQIQNERDTRREAYEDARRQETFKHSRDFLSDDMLGKWRFLELVVEERGGSEDILKAKAARTERKLKGLTLRFWKSGNTAYQYQIENMMSKSHGTYTTHSRVAPPRNTSRCRTNASGRIIFYPTTGAQISDLLFSFAEGIHQQILLSDGEVLSTTLRTRTNVQGVSMKEKQMDLTLDLGMVLAPDGWLHRGNIRCSFERIE